ncbi:AAA family ATPase [Undibacterium sp. TJN19]|uniref:AAA family ATPase n=1 Tax=Undibacterium sp. TJN19 TaxID=3413055 RepID=UPI003BF3025E
MKELVELVTVQNAVPPEAVPDDLASHPVLRSQIRLPTPAIRTAFDILANTALQRAPGCCFHAFPRFGKTSAIEVLIEQLAQSFPEMPMYSINAVWHPRFSETIYMGELLSGCSHVMIATGKFEVRRTRLINYLWTQAKARSTDRIVMFIDEAQNWHEAELTMLRDVTNELAKHHGVQLIAVLFGAPELTTLRSTLIQSGRIDLIGRFMIQQYEFHGITRLDELVTIMGYYDNADISEYPAGSRRCYSEYLLPLAYGSGWRLQQEGPRLWDQFRKSAQGSGGLDDVGMLWVTDSIRQFFLDQIEFDHPGLTGTSNDWASAVLRSGFKDSLGVTYSA